MNGAVYLRDLSVAKTWPALEVVVELDYVDYEDADEATVSVLVSQTRGKRFSATFPHTLWQSGETLGSDELDEHVRRRAIEEVVRYLAARAAA